MARATQQTVKQQKEYPVAILQWQGMKSAMPLTAIPVGALSYSLNMDFRDLNTLQSRGGSRVWSPNTVAGSNSIVGAFEYSASGSTTSLGLKATANGKLLSFSTTVIASDVLLGSLTTSSTLRRVTFAQLMDKVYIADGYRAWEYDPGSGLTALDNATDFDIDPSVKVLAVLEHHHRIWFLCSQGILLCSAVNDPTDFTSVAAWDVTVGRGDGMENSNFISWYDTILVSKESRATKKAAMYRVTGKTPSDYEVGALYNDKDNPTGFVGSSAALIGNDVIGLTRGGFTTATAIQNFAETNISNESRDIRNWISRINFNRSDLCTGIYDAATDQYLCACPIDAADYNNIIFVYDVANNRWGLYDNWLVITFFKLGGKTYFGDRSGQIIETSYGHNDQGGGYNKILETGNIHLDTPDIIKLFKQMDIDILGGNTANYNVVCTPVVDDLVLAATDINLPVVGGTLWDEFVYDEDPYDYIPQTQRTIVLLRRGKNMRLRFFNNQPDEPYALRSLTLRVIKTDAGQMQLPA